MSLTDIQLEWHRKYRENNRDKIHASQKRYRENNVERVRQLGLEAKRRYRVKHSEKVKAVYVAKRKLAEQVLHVKAGRPRPEICEVCGGRGKFSEKRGKGQIVFDHNHTTGEFRGWLCNLCNLTLGLSKEDPQRLRMLADWIEKHSLEARLILNEPVVIRGIGMPLERRRVTLQ